MATTSRGIVYPVVGDALTPLANHFANLATSTDTAISNAMAAGNQQFYGPAASIGGVVGMKLGDTYQESDGNKVLWKYDGSNWITFDGGMYKIRPTAVANATILSDGSVVPNASVVSFRLDGVFSTRFRKYLVVGDFRYSGGNDNATLVQFAAGGVEHTGPSYHHEALFGGGSSPGASQTSGAGAVTIANVLAGEHQMEFYVQNPMDGTRYTKYQGYTSSLFGTSGGMCIVGGGLLVGTPMDGLKFYLQNSSSRSFNGGEVSVYGMA